jgi:hypothetical protein
MATLQSIPVDGTNDRQHRGQLASAVNALQRAVQPLLNGAVTTTFHVEDPRFGASDQLDDNSAAIQAAHDAAEANLGGVVEFRSGAIYKCNETIVWDPRLVGARGNGCTLDFSASAPLDLGADLLTGVNSSFLNGATGDWIFVNAATSAGNGVRIANTVDGVQGYGYLAVTTVPGTTYTVNYTMTQPYENGPQINVYAGTQIDKGDLGYCAGQTVFWFTFIATGTTTYMGLRNATSVLGDYADIANLTVQVCSPTGILMKDRSNALYPNQTPQFGHDAYPFEGFLLVGPGRDTSYIVDAAPPLAQYGGPKGSFGIYLNSPQITGNRNSTSSRGNIRNVTMRNWGAGLVFGNQAYLQFPEHVEIYNSNFGMLGIGSAINAGENNTVIGAAIAGCDVNVASDGVSFHFMHSSLDFPKQAQIRLTAGNPYMRFSHCHIEGSPPGQSTQTVTPIAISSAGGGILFDKTDIFVTGSYAGGSFPAYISTTSAQQVVDFDDAFINNIVTSYLVTGPARCRLLTPSHFFQFPVIPKSLSDQPPGKAPFDCYGHGDFEAPAVATSTIPRGMLAIGANLDDINFASTYSSRFESNKMKLALTSAASHSGSQCLSILKKNDSGKYGAVYFLAPIRPGAQVWWSFWINVPTPIGGNHCDITVTQNFAQLLGVETVLASSNTDITQLTSTSPAGYPFDFSGGAGNYAETAPSSPSPPTNGGLLITPGIGTGGWQFFSVDTFNHGTFQAPAWATHCYLKLDFTGFDGASWGPVSAYLDDLYC